MAYEYELPIILGSSSTGTVLRAQLYDGTTGADVGGEISTGFTELGGGTYHWNYASMPDGHSGGVKIYENGSPTLPLTLGAVSPPETENADVKTSTRSDFDEAVDQVIVVTNNDKTGYALSAAGVDAIWDEILEGTLDGREIMRIMLAALAGKSSGGGTTNVKFRDQADSKDRIDATVTALGSRTAVTVDGS